jgi:hypothetical protein
MRLKALASENAVRDGKAKANRVGDADVDGWSLDVASDRNTSPAWADSAAAARMRCPAMRSNQRKAEAREPAPPPPNARALALMVRGGGLVSSDHRTRPLNGFAIGYTNKSARTGAESATEAEFARAALVLPSNRVVQEGASFRMPNDLVAYWRLYMAALLTEATTKLMRATATSGELEKGRLSWKFGSALTKAHAVVLARPLSCSGH